MRRLSRLAAVLALICVAPGSPSAGDPGPHLLDAVEAYDRGEYQLALIDLEKLARQRNPDAQNRMAEMLRDGRGVAMTDANDLQALKLFHFATLRGHLAAATNLGSWLLGDERARRSVGRSELYRKAIGWLRAAADQGYGPAQVALGLAYRDGIAVPQDAAGAYALLVRAATQGDRTAPVLIGLMLASGELPENRPMMNLLFRLPTSKLADKSDDRPASGVCGKFERYAEANVDERVFYRFFDRGFEVKVGIVSTSDMLRSAIRENQFGYPDYNRVLGRHIESTTTQMAEAQNRETFLRHLKSVNRRLSTPPWMLVDKQTLAQKRRIPVQPVLHKVSGVWERVKMVSLPRAVDKGYREAAMVGFAQAQLNLAIMLSCGWPAGIQRNHVEAYAFYHLADAQGLLQARHLKFELRKSMTADRLMQAHALARKFQAQIARTNRDLAGHLKGALRKAVDSGQILEAYILARDLQARIAKTDPDHALRLGVQISQGIVHRSPVR